MLKQKEKWEVVPGGIKYRSNFKAEGPGPDDCSHASKYLKVAAGGAMSSSCVDAEGFRPNVSSDTIKDSPRPRLRSAAPSNKTSNIIEPDAADEADEHDTVVEIEEHNTREEPKSDSPIVLTERKFPESVSLHKGLDDSWTMKPSTRMFETKRWRDNTFGVAGYGLLHGNHWPEIQQNIVIMVNHALPKKGSWSLLDDNFKARLRDIYPDAKKMVEDRVGSGCQFILRAWVWRILYDNLFSPTCVGKWAGESWAAFGTLHRNLHERVTDENNPFNQAYHVARHNMARMIYMRDGPHAFADRLTRILWREIAPLARIRARDPNADPDESDLELDESSMDRDDKDLSSKLKFELKKSISDLATIAVEADFIILASKWRNKVEMYDSETNKTFGFPYRDGLMEVIPGGGKLVPDQSHTVDFVVEPGLVTYGHQVNMGSNCQGYEAYTRPAVSDYRQVDRITSMKVVVAYFEQSRFKGKKPDE